MTDQAKSAAASSGSPFERQARRAAARETQAAAFSDLLDEKFAFEQYASRVLRFHRAKSILNIQMPFGKYDGHFIFDVPLKYLDDQVFKWDKNIFGRQVEWLLDFMWMEAADNERELDMQFTAGECFAALAKFRGESPAALQPAEDGPTGAAD